MKITGNNKPAPIIGIVNRQTACRNGGSLIPGYTPAHRQPILHIMEIHLGLGEVQGVQEKKEREDRQNDRYCDNHMRVVTLGKGVDGVIRTTLQDIHGTTSIIPNASAYAQAGLLFGTNQEDLISPGNQQFVLAFHNPGPKTMYLNTVSGGVQLPPALLRGYHETIHVTVSSGSVIGGAQVNSVNYKIGSPVTSTIQVTLNPTIQSENRLSITRLPTGEFWLDFNGQIIVPPGSTLIVKLEGNLGEGVGNISYTVTWYELAARS